MATNDNNDQHQAIKDYLKRSFKEGFTAHPAPHKSTQAKQAKELEKSTKVT
jgi:hypothetical protein